MPKGETVGNVVIDGKGGRDRNSYKKTKTDNGGSKEEMNIKRERQRQRKQIRRQIRYHSSRGRGRVTEAAEAEPSVTHNIFPDSVFNSYMNGGTLRWRRNHSEMCSMNGGRTIVVTKYIYIYIYIYN